MSSHVPELLNQKAGQIRVDVGKSNIRVRVRMYTYGVVCKGLWALAWEIGWCIYVVQGLIVRVSKERLEKLSSTTVVQKDFFLHHAIMCQTLFLMILF